MGIRHLEYFMKNDVPNGFTKVDIKKEIQAFEKENKIQPVIVIDMMGFVSYLCRNKFDLLCGGRHKKYSLLCDQLFQSLKDAGAELVFFQDGPVQEVKLNTWWKRQNIKYSDCLKILNLVYLQKPLQEIVELETVNRSLNIPTLSTLICALETSASQHGTVYKSKTVECDLEIAEYATRTNAMAIMADDSDYLIFQGNWSYWSIKELNNLDLTTQRFDRWILRDYLRLSDYQMAILATIAGNDIINFDYVKEFHRYLGNTSSNHKFPNIAKYVGNNFHNQTPFATACEIARNVLKDSGSETVELVLKSLLSYDLNYDKQAPLFQDDPLLHACLENNYQFTFEVLRGTHKSFTLLYFDMMLTDMPVLYSDLTLALYQRQIGIILDHQRDKHPFRIVNIKMNHETPHQSINVIPIYPPEGSIPPLMVLMLNNDDNTTRIKWMLLKWIINADRMLGARDLQKIPIEYLTDLLVIAYLVENQMINVLEADMILMTINHVNLNIVPFKLDPPKVLNQRAFRISFLFTKLYASIRKCLNVVGLKNHEKVLDFDGVYFHWMYLKYICSGNLEALPLQMSDVKKYRLYDVG